MWLTELLFLGDRLKITGLQGRSLSDHGFGPLKTHYFVSLR